MQKSTAWNMPLAPVVAKNWSVYTYLPLQVRSTFYWWIPCLIAANCAFSGNPVTVWWVTLGSKDRAPWSRSLELVAIGLRYSVSLNCYDISGFGSLSPNPTAAWYHLKIEQ